MINGTLVAQIIHFFIAYLIIDKVFLQNALMILQQEDQEASKNMSKIASLQELNNQLNQKKTHQWNLFKYAFNERQPKIAPLPEMVHVQKSSEYKNTFQEKDVQKLVNVVVERIDRGSTS